MGSPHSLKNTEKENRRKALLEAANRLFPEMGYSGTTIEAIARKAGMAKGSFYLYFDGKEEIFRSLIEHQGERIIGEINEIVSARGGIEDKLKRIAWNIMRWHLESSHPWAFVLMEEGIDHNEIMMQFFEKRMRIMEIINSVFVEGMKTGELCREEPDRISAMFLGCIDGTIIRGCCLGCRLDPEIEALWMTRRFLTGILATGGVL